MTRDTAGLIVVGGGIAGLVAALSTPRDTRVTVVSKGSVLSSSSWLAQGGVAAALDAEDSPAQHAADTFTAGRGLCRPSAVRVLTEEAPARIVELSEMGVGFDEGLGLEGGHSQRRIVHAGGAATGERIARALAGHAARRRNIEIVDGLRVLDLWMAGERCVGIVTETGTVAAHATILATGGMAALWERTTNPAGSVGDGATLAFRSGAALADLEFVQFHPTVLATNGLLLSEALRGEGAVLLDREGERFTDELAPRDVVARAIDARGTALLDLRPVNRRRFSGLIAQLEAQGYDPGTEPIPVAPAAHYTMGGIVTDLDGRTEIPSLYAAGECAGTGVHGANRLASNSLLECIVFSRRAALASLGEPGLPNLLPAPHGSEPLPHVTPEVRRAIWQDAGLVRDAAGLERLERSSHPLTGLIATGALRRSESRGGHFRIDYPIEDPSLAVHIVQRPGEEPALEPWA